DTRFRRENSGAEPEEQVLADISPGRRTNRSTGRDQFPQPNFAQADFAGRAGYLSGKRDLGFLIGRSQQSPASRLPVSRGDAFLFIEQNARGTSAKLAGWPHQNVSHPARTAFSKRTCRSFPERKLSGVARDRRVRRAVHSLCATIGTANGRHHYAA